tara:strand:+ start:1178 stop:2047 length:870 start_codon:yes stop_codon:yes gene_type:complete
MIHLVYPYDPMRVAAPWSIGNHLAAGLRRAGHQVRQYDWENRACIQPVPGDILLGHPHPAPGFVFRNSVCGPWRRVVAMSPWNGSTEYSNNLGYVSDNVDTLLCICGKYWADKHFGDGSLDMAVDPDDFPTLTREIRPPGDRRMLYIGCTLAIKGPGKIAEVAAMYPGKVGHCGYGTIPGTTCHGYVDFSTDAGRAVLAEYDFLITLADHDANPTTVLEAMCWGLVPLCSPGSGYVAPDVVVIDSPSVIDYWQQAPTQKLIDRQRLGAALVREKYTWNRFVDRVLEVIQ